MPQRRVEPISREGGWTLEGGYRRRANRSLELLGDRAREFETHLAYAHKAPGPLKIDMRLLDEMHLLSDSAVVFSAMAVESFLNFYGVVTLGDQFYSRHYERLTPKAKLAAIAATCRAHLLSDGDEIVEVTGRVFERRNALVHPKTREATTPMGTPPPTAAFLPRASEAVADMERFFALFIELDPAASGYTQL